MGIFEQFPYTNFHELNADWLMKELLKLKTTVAEFVSINALKYADPIQWSIVRQYEKNTIVIDPLTGTAYISVQPVPSGVALTRTEYWTVVFDLGSFVVRAAKNFTDKFEEDTTLTATFSSAVNDWLIWGDTLYRVISNITAGDQYVVDSNIEHFTIEDVIGHLEDLTTADKSNIVAAINEVMTIIGNEVLTTTAQTLRGAINELNELSVFVTPEMFGAVGDGVSDDTAAIQSAIASGKPVIGMHDYLINDTITINGNVILKIDGSIIYAGSRTKPAILVSGYYNDISINRIIDAASVNYINFDGGWHGWASTNYAGIEGRNLYNSNIYVNSIINFTVGLKISADNDGNFNNNYSGKFIFNCKYGIYITDAGAYGWLNCSTISGFEIGIGSQGTDIETNASAIRQYGIYQELGASNTYGCKYCIIKDIMLEITYKDLFTGIYAELMTSVRFENIIAELTNAATFAEFNIVLTTSGDVTSRSQFSYNNEFVNTHFMGAPDGKAITFTGLTSAIITSLEQVAKYDTDKFDVILEDHRLYGKALVTNNTGGVLGTQGVLKGYSFTRLNYSGNIDTCKLCHSEDGSVRNDTSLNCLRVPATTPISLLIPVKQYETYHIKAFGPGTNHPSVALKTFASDGSLIDVVSNREKAIAGNFTISASDHVYSTSPSNNYEFTVLDASVAYIMVFIHQYISEFEISLCNGDKPIVLRHWGNFNFLNFGDADKFYNNATPTSEVNDNTTYVGQKIYKVDNSGFTTDIWTLTGGGWQLNV